MSRCQCCGHTSADYVNPQQLGLFTTIICAEVYARGYDSGLFWDASWYPGGPWVYTVSGFGTAEKHKQARDSKEEHDAWHHGFKDGLEIRLKNKHFRKWWESKRNGPYARYDAPLDIG